MKNLSLKLALLLPFVILLLSLTAEAQSKKISMQGFLKDANGKAVADGNKVLTFKIYDAVSGGSAIWAKVFSQVNVVGGVYAVQLGPSDGSIEISTLAWDVPYYVGITVESEPELTPRTEFTYAPYTFAVNKANLADVATYATTAGAIGGDLDLASGGFTADMRILRNSKAITGTNSDNNMHMGYLSGANSDLYFYSNNAVAMKLEGLGLAIGGNFAPTATLDVARGNLINGTAMFRGTSYPSHFNWGGPENTHIRGGKAGSVVFINDIAGGEVRIASEGGNVSVGHAGSYTPQATLDVARGTSAGGTAIFRGTNNVSFFNHQDAENTYIRGGKAGSIVYINDAPNGEVRIASEGGNVSVGPLGYTPQATLDVARGTSVNGTAIFRGTNNVSFFNHQDAEDTYIRGGKAGSKVYINDGSIGGVSIAQSGGNVLIAGGGGRVGIGSGITDPGANLHVGGNLVSSALNYSSWFNTSTGSFIQQGAQAHGYIAIRSDGSIWANGFSFISTSDKRIKNIIGISQSASDLALINKIEITDYKYKDEISSGAGLHKKVIAQQVQEFFPQAIKTSKGIIPSVYALAKATEVKEQTTRITTTKPHDFKTGDLVKLIVEKVGEKQLTVTVLDEHTFSIAEAIEDKIFVYGKHVDDLLTVDYDALAMLNVSATQELSKQIELLKAENAKLKTENKNYESRLTKIEAMLNVGQTVLTGK
jgi:hypothetical protein